MDETIRIPLVEEKLGVEVEQKTTGRLRVRTTTEVIEELATADLEQFAVEVHRIPIDKVVESPPDVRVEGDVTVIPVLEEVLVVEKRLILKEEIHVVRTSTTETAEIPVALRKQKAIVDRVQQTNEDIKGDDDADGV